MFTGSERRLLVRAIGVLLARGLLAREDEAERVAFRVDGCGYRYLRGFWEAAGVLKADGARWRLRGDPEHARRHVTAAWVIAGAPIKWARMEGDAAAESLFVPPPFHPQACRVPLS